MDINQYGGMVSLVPFIYIFVISTIVAILLFITYFFINRKMAYLIFAIVFSIVSVGSGIFIFNR